MIELAIATIESCSWDRPGHNPFTGDVVAAVDRYTDIPASTRSKLKKRMKLRRYDEIVAIRRDSITGSGTYAPEIRDMHFGRGQVCATVTRARWPDDAVERGLVYCEDGHCILVPTVCRNVSRITRLSQPYEQPIDMQPSAGRSFQVLALPPVALPQTPPPAVSFIEMSAPPPIAISERQPTIEWPDYYTPPLVVVHAPPPPISEPSSAALMAAGIATLIYAIRRRPPSLKTSRR